MNKFVKSVSIDWYAIIQAMILSISHSPRNIGGAINPCIDTERSIHLSVGDGKDLDHGVLSHLVREDISKILLIVDSARVKGLWIDLYHEAIRERSDDPNIILLDDFDEDSSLDFTGYRYVYVMNSRNVISCPDHRRDFASFVGERFHEEVILIHLN